MANSPVRGALTDSYLAEILNQAGLDAEYVSAAGDVLRMRGPEGESVPVLDFAGGYGALLLGHNHPEIVEFLRGLLAEEVPVLAQFSRQSAAEECAARLDSILRRETGTDTHYHSVFANTGAEAIEAAAKHAEFDRVRATGERIVEVSDNVDRVGALVTEGAARVPEHVWSALGTGVPETTATGEALVERVRERNAALDRTPPRFLAMKGGFHGKLMGSVGFTHNPGYRLPFGELAPRTDFVSFEDPAELELLLSPSGPTLTDLRVSDGEVALVDVPVRRFTALLVEPVQGEGGINLLSERTARRIQELCRSADCPVIVDEIQSGMGRTGSFLASSPLGLVGDYYVLAKALGGGIAKTAVALVREDRYRREFELLHSSTFAKDGLSTRVALRVLDILERDGGALYRAAADKGERLLALLEGVRAEYGDVIADVRGRGLMVGVEFRDQSGSPAQAISELASAGYLGYAISGYFLREHRIRTFPTASAVNTLRLEPSVNIGPQESKRFAEALRSVCELLRKHDAERLFG